MGGVALILLDTATWIWFANESPDLSPSAVEAVATHETRLVCAISIWEVGMLVGKKRIFLDRPMERWVDEALRLPGVEPVPVDPAIALLATLLPGDPPTDPADRMIVASALHRGCPVVTPDRRLHQYPFVPTIW